MTFALFGLTAIEVARPLAWDAPSWMGLGPAGIQVVPFRLMIAAPVRAAHQPAVPGSCRWALTLLEPVLCQSAACSSPLRADAATAGRLGRIPRPWAWLRLRVCARGTRHGPFGGRRCGSAAAPRQRALAPSSCSLRSLHYLRSDEHRGKPPLLLVERQSSA